MSDLDNLLDVTLDDLEDLPTFTPFPVGSHRVMATFESKDMGGKLAIELSFTMIETLEYAVEPVEGEDGKLIGATKEGDTSNTLFFMANEFGSGNFKKCAKPFAAAMGFTTTREIVENVKQVECVIITALKQDKRDPEKFYLDVKEIAVV